MNSTDKNDLPPIRKTDAWKKFHNYADSLLSNPDFLSELRWFRQRHRHMITEELLPEAGLPLPDGEEEYYEDRNYVDPFFLDEEYEEEGPKYENRKKDFIAKYKLETFGEAFDFLLLYNSTRPMDILGFAPYLDVIDLRFMTDLQAERMSTEAFGEYTPERCWEYFLHTSETKPIAIAIHPYMTQNDILDAIRKIYKTEIEPLQIEYRDKKVNLGSARTKSRKVKDMADFIYANKDLSLKNLTSLVNRKFCRGKEPHDYTYIQTILRQEKKKRN